MIQFRDVPAPPPAPVPPNWPGCSAFLSAPHVRIDRDQPISWSGFVAANALDEEEQAEIWHNLATCGAMRVRGDAGLEILLTGCGRPGSTAAAESDAFAKAEEEAERATQALSRDPRSIRLCDLLAVAGRSAGLGPVTVIFGGIVLKTTADGRGLYGCRRAGGAR